MQLKHNGLLMQVAYFGWGYLPGPGERVSLCALFWRTLFTITWVMITVFIFTILLLITIFRFRETLLGIGIAGAIIGMALTLVWLIEDGGARKIAHSPLGTLVKGVKDRYCPIITLK